MNNGFIEFEFLEFFIFTPRDSHVISLQQIKLLNLIFEA